MLNFNQNTFLQIAEDFGSDVDMLYRSFNDEEPEFYSFNHDPVMYSWIIEAICKNAKLLLQCYKG